MVSFLALSGKGKIVMKEFVEYIAKSLVSDPSKVWVEEISSPKAIVLELHVAEDDMGRVIGKGGRVANAMRTLLQVASVRQGKKYMLEIVG